jgi:tRNA dimethylallyltransferase
LRRLDPAAAVNIHANDTPKLLRAIEVCLSARTKMSEMWKQGRDPLQGFQIVRIGLDPDRDLLYQRINRRAEDMFNGGLIEETKQLIEEYGDGIRPLGALGYKQAASLLRGEIDRESALGAAQQAHRNYAKRQITWFRREPEVMWLAGFGDNADIQREAIRLVARKTS